MKNGSGAAASRRTISSARPATTSVRYWLGSVPVVDSTPLSLKVVR